MRWGGRGGKLQAEMRWGASVRGLIMFCGCVRVAEMRGEGCDLKDVVEGGGGACIRWIEGGVKCCKFVTGKG